MNLLGIAQSHCSAACLVRGGAVVGMVQEERLTKAQEPSRISPMRDRGTAR